MKLISCDACGVVLDADRLPFLDDIHDEEGCVDESKAVWENRDFVAFVPCPVCQEPILQPE